MAFTRLVEPILSWKPPVRLECRPEKSLLATGAATPFEVTFTPTFAGPREAAIPLQRHDEDAPLFVIRLSSIGVAP